jgi:FKBP-type peptidyl-prolyl cis-trans isomerase
MFSSRFSTAAIVSCVFLLLATSLPTTLGWSPRLIVSSKSRIRNSNNDGQRNNSFHPATLDDSQDDDHYDQRRASSWTLDSTMTTTTTTRRNVFGTVLPLTLGVTVATATATATGFFPVAAANAADSSKPQEFTNIGTQAPPPTPEDNPFVTLPSGVKIKDFKLGTGDAVVSSTSKRVNLQCSGRLLNLNGVVFYNTKTNNPDGFGPVPLVIDLGQGQALPGFEQGLIGMKKGGIRRMIVPQDLAYNKFPTLQPQPLTANDQRALDSVVKNSRRDGTILFDVQVERFK